MQVDKKTFTIGVLSLSAVILLVANIMAPPRANASMVVKDRDYQAVTARILQGDEGLYILDNRTGDMAVFVFDANQKRLVVKAHKPIMEAFPPPGR